MLKYKVNDEEYDKLNMREQMKYRWCQKCKIFYNTDVTDRCICENLKKISQQLKGVGGIRK